MSDYHIHKFFIYQVKADFEPVSDVNSEIGTTYRRVEYAYSGCNCGAAIRSKVKSSND